MAGSRIKNVDASKTDWPVIGVPMVSAFVNWLKKMTLVREGPGSSPVRVNFSKCLIDVMIIAPMTCLTLNRLQKSDGRP